MGLKETVCISLLYEASKQSEIHAGGSDIYIQIRYIKVIRAETSNANVIFLCHRNNIMKQ